MRKYAWISLILLFAIIGFAIVDIQRQQNDEAQKTLLGTSLPAFELADLEGNMQSSTQWDGKVRLINLWAAWCPPCRREIPAFAEVYDFYAEQGFVVVGIAIDELEPVKKFLAKHKQVKYPQMIGMQDAIEIGSKLGNASGGLPYSVIVDRQGIIRFIRQGELEKDTLLNLIEPLLEQ